MPAYLTTGETGELELICDEGQCREASVVFGVRVVAGSFFESILDRPGPDLHRRSDRGRGCGGAQPRIHNIVTDDSGLLSH